MSGRPNSFTAQVRLRVPSSDTTVTRQEPGPGQGSAQCMLLYAATRFIPRFMYEYHYVCLFLTICLCVKTLKRHVIEGNCGVLFINEGRLPFLEDDSKFDSRTFINVLSNLRDIFRL